MARVHGDDQSGTGASRWTPPPGFKTQAGGKTITLATHGLERTLFPKFGLQPAQHRLQGARVSYRDPCPWPASGRRGRPNRRVPRPASERAAVKGTPYFVALFIPESAGGLGRQHRTRLGRQGRGRGLDLQVFPGIEYLIVLIARPVRQGRGGIWIGAHGELEPVDAHAADRLTSSGVKVWRSRAILTGLPKTNGSSSAWQTAGLVEQAWAIGFRGHLAFGSSQIEKDPWCRLW